MLKDHLGKLEYFCNIVETGSLQKASQKAYVSQPQLSKVLRQLEEELDTQLLIRRSDGVIPTPAGDKLYSYARETIDQANQMQLLIRDNVQASGNVYIGTYDSISRYFFPDFIKYLRKLAPSLNIILSTGRSSQKLKELKKGELDIAIIVSSGVKSRSLSEKIIYSDSFGLYHSQQIESSFLDHIIKFPESIHFDATKLGFKHILSCDNLETVKSLTEQGLGVGLLPHRVAREGVLQGKLIPHKKVLSQESEHNISLFYSKKNISAHAQVVINEVERFLTTWAKS
ncbi:MULTISPECIES: LysR family transcriptional regulator [Halobacteriovorax]|uniref:LysR family transcriptional regulator n=1 Tax=Halobacteriovorax vibrionivorans TaxID=2152716 RepID=A0ABY0IFF7_9BACT|nr:MULTISPECIES: LysR family transcriptional regulator [Halobacteriovorax]AYF43795.1 putative LysR-family regulatory protein [Halobacteriovorax sp. BALOs_7]RZF21673.1 LysR family transcriptional regulator [Halobacteriovorax vibrionivorans]TGD49035.1 LysR family transcriptional regulator [Halobacteriovorax sp. Y22]